jgi:large subunit ribosomal protein L28
MTFALACASLRALDGRVGSPYESRSSIASDKDRAMARRCELTGKGVMSGHLVSHANNRKKRVFRPNLQTVSLASDTLGQMVSLKISMNALRTVDRNGGLDVFLLKARDEALSTKALRLKRQIAKKQAKTASAA